MPLGSVMISITGTTSHGSHYLYWFSWFSFTPILYFLSLIITLTERGLSLNHSLYAILHTGLTIYNGSRSLPTSYTFIKYTSLTTSTNHDIYYRNQTTPTLCTKPNLQKIPNGSSSSRYTNTTNTLYYYLHINHLHQNHPHILIPTIGITSIYFTLLLTPPQTSHHRHSPLPTIKKRTRHATNPIHPRVTTTYLNLFHVQSINQHSSLILIKQGYPDYGLDILSFPCHLYHGKRIVISRGMGWLIHGMRD